jgi:hypothetical protein
VRSTFRKPTVASLLGLATLFAGGEVFARFVLGLGDPPLSVAHPTIEYMFKAQDAQRFGNRFLVNEYGMRNEALSPAPARDETRVLVYGDSVVNGGALTDHKDLATTDATYWSSRRNARPFVYLNVSAESWGPGNQLAHMKTYGFFGASAAILVLSSHDANDEPTFAPLDPSTHPTKAPFSALTEGASRYLPRVAQWAGFAAARPQTDASPTVGVFASENALQEIFDLMAAQRLPACVFMHPTRQEIASAPAEGHGLISRLAVERGVPVFNLAETYKGTTIPERVYRDDIHITKFGHAALSKTLRDVMDLNLCRPPRARGG